jgi:PAS domain S-box-containing protein
MSAPDATASMQMRVRHRNGEWRWVESIERNLTHIPGVAGIIYNMRDVHDRREALEALRESEERFRLAFENALAGMAILDAAGNYQWVNRSFCRMLGFRRQELLALGLQGAVHPDDFEAARQDAAHLFAGRIRSYQRERRLVHKDGHVVWVLLSAAVLRKENGKVVQVMGQVHDISEWKRLESALRASDERYRALVRNSSDIITVLDANGTVVSMSAASERVLGFRPEELIGKSNAELCHPDDVRRLNWTFARSLHSPGVKRRVELRFRHKDGSYRWLEVMPNALLSDPAIGGIVADARDITEQKEAAAALLEANTQLERLNQAKTDFVSLVSHEFRTPLTGIRGFSELIRDGDFTLDEVREFANDINDDAQRLARLIDQMLDLERMQSGRMQLHRDPVDLNQTIKEIAQRLRATTNRHQIRLDLDEMLPVFIGDQDKLVQVFTNLIANAIKYSPEGGDLVVKTRANQEHVHLTVCDPGIGIPSSDLERIFDRYARVEGGAGRFVKGIGLGLPIARQIVEMHGGTIWAESVVHEGSVFHVVLPLTPDKE